MVPNRAALLPWPAMLALAIAPLAVAPLPAGAQDIIDQCRMTQSDAERADCLEAFIRGEMTAPPGEAEAAVPAPSPAPAPAPTPATPPAAAAAAETASEGRGFFRAPRIPFIGGRDDGASPETAVASSSAVADELGAEQVAAASRERAPLRSATASVVSFQVVPYQRLEVELDNGQIWRQTQSGDHWDTRRYSDPEMVEITEGRFGGYRMQVDGRREMLDVERVR